MSEIVNNAGQSALAQGEAEDVSLESRLWRSMLVVVALSVLISAIFAPWRVTTGVLLGGALSLFNHYWLRTSVRAIFSIGPTGTSTASRLVAARYVLRYLIMALVVASAYALDLISLVATLAGICSFVAALMIEAAVLLFRAVIYGEGD